MLKVIISYRKYFIIFIARWYTICPFDGTLATCDSWWLEEHYGDILPTINNRPGFPAAVTESFQVGVSPILKMYTSSKDSNKSFNMSKGRRKL